MRITQGTFSFLPDLSHEQISRQVEYCLDKGWAIGIEYTDDPHPRNTFWEMFGNPMFDIKDAAGVMLATPILTVVTLGSSAHCSTFRRMISAM